METKKQVSQAPALTGTGIAIGSGLGLIFGLLWGNLQLGMVLGVAAGLTIGAGIDMQRARKHKVGSN